MIKNRHNWTAMILLLVIIFTMPSSYAQSDNMIPNDGQEPVVSSVEIGYGHFLIVIIGLLIAWYLYWKVRKK